MVFSLVNWLESKKNKKKKKRTLLSIAIINRRPVFYDRDDNRMRVKFDVYVIGRLRFREKSRRLQKPLRKKMVCRSIMQMRKTARAGSFQSLAAAKSGPPRR